MMLTRDEFFSQMALELGHTDDCACIVVIDFGPGDDKVDTRTFEDADQLGLICYRSAATGRVWRLYLERARQPSWPYRIDRCDIAVLKSWMSREGLANCEVRVDQSCAREAQTFQWQTVNGGLLLIAVRDNGTLLYLRYQLGH